MLAELQESGVQLPGEKDINMQINSGFTIVKTKQHILMYTRTLMYVVAVVCNLPIFYFDFGACACLTS